MSTQAVAGAIQLRNDGVVERAVERGRGDDGIAEDLGPLGKVLSITAARSHRFGEADFREALQAQEPCCSAVLAQSQFFGEVVVGRLQGANLGMVETVGRDEGDQARRASTR